jgi:universal stress protein E
MDKLTSILAVANRTRSDRGLLEKAVLLARRMGAQIHLLSCDAALARILHRAYNTEDAEKAWRVSQSEHLAYLGSLRERARAPDVRISIDVQCHSPSYECIVNKARATDADLVMKSPSGEHPLHRFGFGPSDWHLLRECPTTLMLVTQSLWRSPPNFAALVNVTGESAECPARSIIHTAEQFALSFGAELDVVYSEPSSDLDARQVHADALQRLTREYHIAASRSHVLSGTPEVTLPGFVAEHPYDVLILGGLTHRGGLAPLVGGLTGKLVEAVEKDFILVKQKVALWPSDHASVLWPAMFGD